MKILCYWISKEKKKGIQTPQLKTRVKEIGSMSGEQFLDQVTSLLAKEETVRLILEQGDIKK